MARLRPSPSGRAMDLLTFSSTAAALPTTLYVDIATLVETEDQYGSAVAPYKTLTQAIAHANAGSSIAWHFIIAFGDYRSEPALQLLTSRRYIFDGIFRSSVIMRLPTIIWTVSGTDTSYLHFRNVEAGMVTVLDGSPASSTTVIVYENSACQGINAATALAAITVLMSGTSLASYETSSNTFVLAVARLSAINLNNGTLFAQNVQFDATCPLIRANAILTDGCSFAQSMQINGTSVELRESRWTTGSPFFLTFLGSAGVASLDPHTQHSFDILSVTLVNGSIIATDQTYNTSSVIPLPEGSTTGQATLGTATTFSGASYRLVTYTSANNIYVIATAVSAPTTLVIACYQNANGQTAPTIARVGVASLLISAPGTFLVPLSATMRLVPGVLFILIGKVSGGGNITVRTYTTPTQELLNDASVPSGAYPTGFTTTVGVTTNPPATFNPTPGGGVVTPAGASNVDPSTGLRTAKRCSTNDHRPGRHRDRVRGEHGHIEIERHSCAIDRHGRPTLRRHYDELIGNIARSKHRAIRVGLSLRTRAVELQSEGLLHEGHAFSLARNPTRRRRPITSATQAGAVASTYSYCRAHAQTDMAHPDARRGL